MKKYLGIIKIYEESMYGIDIKILSRKYDDKKLR